MSKAKKLERTFPNKLLPPIGYSFGPRSWRRPPRLPLHRVTALQHWRQGSGNNSDVSLRGH